MASRPKGKRQDGPDQARTVAGKNSNGAGSIYLDARGAYRATFIDPVSGKRRTVTAKTKAEVEARRAAAMATASESSPNGQLGPAPTMAELGAWWLHNVAAVQVRPATLHAYSKDVARIVGQLGETQVAALDTEAVTEFLAELRRNGRATGTIRNTRATLRQIAETAVDLGYLTANPVIRVRVPKGTAEERTVRRVLTVDEIHRLLEALDPARPYDAVISLLFTSGNRVSEVLGLAWSDLDLDAGTATVRRACTYSGGGVGTRLDSPKTASTAGVHHLAPSAVAALRARRVRQLSDRLAAGPAWEQLTYEGAEIDLCFTTVRGGLVARQHVSKALTDACIRAGIDPSGVGTHTGRRSTVTALYVAGVALDDVARHVGHSSPETTARYVSDLGDRPRDTASIAARLLDPAAGRD